MRIEVVYPKRTYGNSFDSGNYTARLSKSRRDNSLSVKFSFDFGAVGLGASLHNTGVVDGGAVSFPIKDAVEIANAILRLADTLESGDITLRLGSASGAA